MSQRMAFKTIVISASMAVLLIGFQNCSNKISQQDVSGEALKAAGQDQSSSNGSTTSPDSSSVDSDQLPDNSTTLVDQPSNPPVMNPPTPENPPVMNPPTVQNPPVMNPPTTTEPQLNQEDQDCIAWALADEPEAATSCLKHKNSDSSEESEQHQASVPPKVSPEKCYVKSEEDQDNIDYNSICRLNKKQVKFLNVVSNILKLFKLRGLTVLTPESVGSSSLVSLEDARGTTILCGLKVEKINNTRGKLVAIDSSIKSFANHRGKIVFINTTAESCTDIKGKFVLLGAQSACKNIEKSKALVQIDRD